MSQRVLYSALSTCLIRYIEPRGVQFLPPLKLNIIGEINASYLAMTNCMSGLARCQRDIHLRLDKRPYMVTKSILMLCFEVNLLYKRFNTAL